ncbi:MAG: terminase family protein [Alphaproteobacteria bacterium]
MQLPNSWKTLPLPNLLAIEARLRWIKDARPSQLTPSHDWRLWLVLAGRGWGKTRTGAEDLARYALWNDGARLGVVAPTFADARDTCVEGESGLLHAIPRACVKKWNRSLGELILRNGSIVKLFSADEPDRLRGPQHHRVWCDELAAWARPEAFDQMMLGLRLGGDPRAVITTTPRPTLLVRSLVARAGSDLHLTRGRTGDNAANLPAALLAELKERYDGTRLGRQEMEAEILEDDAGALWKAAEIASCTVSRDRIPAMRRVVVAVDPALGHGEKNDETGIIAAGLGEDGFLYVLGDASGRFPSDIWAARAAHLAETCKATSIVVEVNAGGELLTRLLQQHAPSMICRAVRAGRSKWDRAVPIALLYEQRRVRHAGLMPELAAQMASFSFAEIARSSPDRVDALVWALDALMRVPNANPGIRML